MSDSDEYINKFINSNGTYNYAFVVMIIKNDIYANPAIIFSESLRKVGSLIDIVAVIDKSISIETIDLLKKFYNRIILIDIININNKDNIQNIILTKVNIFNLIEYKKICIIDVDTIIFSNIDNIFLKKNDSNIIYSLDENNFGFILIEPSYKLYKKSIQIINDNYNKLGKEKKPFNFLIKKLFINIKKFDIKILLNKYDNSDGIQYTEVKPFLMTSQITIEERMRLNLFKVWFNYFNNILNKYEEIKNYKCIKETLEVSKYFIESLTRFIINFVSKKKKNQKDYIINIYGQNIYKNLDYYHLDITRNYSSYNINYNLNFFNLKSFLEYLDSIKYYEKKFIKYYNYKDSKDLINKIKNDEKLLNIFLNKYIKVYPNIFIVIEIDNFNYNLEIPDLKNNLVFTKKIYLEKNILINIFFNLFQNYTYNQRLIFFNSIKSSYVRISIFETISDINSNNFSNSNLFLFFEPNSKIRIASIFFNPDSIEYFKNNKLLDCITINETKLEKNTINLKNLIKITYLQTLKKWICNIYTGEEIENLFIKIIDDNNNKFKLLDNNNHNINKIKKIIKNKIFFIEIIFIKSSQYKNILLEENIKTTDLYLLENNWEFEGIKFIKN